MMQTMTIQSNILPSWMLAPEDAGKTNKQIVRETREKRFENFFESTVLPGVERGISIKKLMEEDQRNFDYSGFLRWVDKDPNRRSRLDDAQRIGTELLLDECVEIADGVSDSGVPEDVQRSKLRIETRMFKIKNWNRKKYGNHVTVETHQSININAVLEQANSRVPQLGRIIDHDDLEDK